MRQRLLDNIQVAASGCWEWQGLKTNTYGQLSINGKPVRAHRLSYEEYKGPIAERMHVLHRCDNPKCINPEHLFLGTHADNMSDMAAKGRAVGGGHVLGEQHYCAKLTASDVIAIRSSEEPQRKLAARYGVSQRTISAAKHGETWKHVALQ